MAYLIYILFGVLPSLIWLAFYLRKDAHPESNRMILKIFFWGVLITVPAALLELGIIEEINKLPAFLKGIPGQGILISALYFFLGIALVEEVLKYLVIRWKVLKNSEFDEPLDVMLYMIIAALGFAALENILVLFPLGSPFRIMETSMLCGLRFIGATFLHALCSGLVGYFLALSFFETKNRIKLTVIGLGLAVCLHGLYNIFIININRSIKILEDGRAFIENPSLFTFSLISVIIILIGLAVFVSYGFKKLKGMKSICQMK